MIIRVTYDEVAVYRRKSGTCSVCGKPAVRKGKFWQTLNPSNKKNGRVKTRKEILVELGAIANKWVAEPITHARCE